MKKLFALGLLAALLTVTAAAQETPVDKGSMVIGGNVYFMSQSGDLYENMDGDSYSEFGLTPSFGYFISPGLLIGAEFEFASAKQGDNDASTMGIGPVVGYYFNINKERSTITGSIYPYIKGFFMYGSMSVNDDDASGMVFGGQAGINYMLSSAVAVDLGVRFSSDSWEPDGGDSVSGTSMMIGAGIQAFIF